MDRIFDPKMYYLAKMEWSEAFLPVVSEELIRILGAVDGTAKKCLVLDLDNTLWGGVVGEDGPRGVKVGTGDPASEAFADFQHKILSLKDRGILLAICSKNNPEDVHELFSIRKEMPLSLDDFAAVRINWENKSKNIAELASELNIGLESMVFVDDNPAECELVRQMLPQVTTVHLPADPTRYPSLLDELPLFEKVAILEADRKKTQQYSENRQRRELQASVGDLTAYLESLGTEITIRKPDAADLDRVHQLFTKTNQFNLTTIRYAMPDIATMTRGEEMDLYIVDARDKFGDLGTIGLYLLRHNGGTADVDSFILSCRAMGRGIESAVMNHLKKRCFEGRAARWINARYIPTRKNQPVANFFEDQYFQVQSVTPDGEKLFQLSAQDNTYAKCSWIQVSAKEE
jgi:FkbH-like protein